MTRLAQVKAERDAARADRDRFHRVMNDLANGYPIVTLGHYLDDGLRITLRAGRLDSPDGGYVLVTSHGQSGDYTTVFPADEFRANPAQYLGRVGTMAANDALCRLTETMTNAHRVQS